jgi:hypothetical protein
MAQGQETASRIVIVFKQKLSPLEYLAFEKVWSAIIFGHQALSPIDFQEDIHLFYSGTIGDRLKVVLESRGWNEDLGIAQYLQDPIMQGLEKLNVQLSGKSFDETMSCVCDMIMSIEIQRGVALPEWL